MFHSVIYSVCVVIESGAAMNVSESKSNAACVAQALFVQVYMQITYGLLICISNGEIFLLCSLL